MTISVDDSPSMFMGPGAAKVCSTHDIHWGGNNGGTFTSFTTGTSWSFSGWVQPASADITSGYHNIISNGNGSIGFWIDAGKMDAYFISDHLATTKMTAGNWYLLVFTYDGTTGRFYQNGSTDGTTTGQSFVLGYMGANTGSTGTGETMNGEVDDFRVYTRVLSATEVSNLYAGQDIDATSLAAHWKFDEGSGTSAADTTGNHSATLTSGTVWGTDVPTPLVCP